MRRGPSAWAVLQEADRLPWKSAVDSILSTHLYQAGWSSLALPHSVYHAVYVAIAAAAVGAATLWRRPEIQSLLFIYGAFWVAQLFNAMQVFATAGVPASLGWHLYAVIGAQVVLTIAGLRRIVGGSGIWIAAAIYGALDLYGMHAVAMPYFTGTVAGDGVGWGEMFARLAFFKPPFVTEGVLIALWSLYLMATVALLAISVRVSRAVTRG
jgi:hypothetical protein